MVARVARAAGAVVAVLLLALPARATDVSDADKKHCRDTVKTISKCPVTGCPADHHPNLDRQKNRTDAVSSPTTMTVADVVALTVDNAWGEDEPAASMQAAGEGKAVTVEGNLVHYAPETSGESCNCYLTKQANNDVHLNLVGSLAQTSLDSTTARLQSIVVGKPDGSWVSLDTYNP